MKTLLITGASTGFGRSIAEESLARGHRVVLAVRSPESVADLIEGHAGQAAAIQFDLTNPEDPAKAVAETISRYGQLDVLVNNAGYGLLAALEETTDEQIKRLEKPGEWNAYEVRCEGPKITIILNGETTVTYTEEDKTIALDGLIALQIHGNSSAEISFRHLTLEALP